MQEELLNIERVVTNRKTTKVMSENNFPATQQRELIERILACAGWAPFHRACSNLHRTSVGQSQEQLTGVEPWRFYLVDAQNCRRLRTITSTMEASGKIPSMLATATAVAIATWLPNPPRQATVEEAAISGESVSHPQVATADSEYFEPTVENVEHIAAAAAAIQSLLLAATAAGFHNYWSSGGVLRSPRVLTRLGIPLAQRVLGAVFLFPANLPESETFQIVGSKLRDSRGGISAWSRWVSISEAAVPTVPNVGD